eukprot:2593176-Alexandrium_andersonii.AAC.1
MSVPSEPSPTSTEPANGLVLLAAAYGDSDSDGAAEMPAAKVRKLDQADDLDDLNSEVVPAELDDADKPVAEPLHEPIHMPAALHEPIIVPDTVHEPVAEPAALHEPINVPAALHEPVIVSDTDDLVAEPAAEAKPS